MILYNTYIFSESTAFIPSDKNLYKADTIDADIAIVIITAIIIADTINFQCLNFFKYKFSNVINA